MTSRADRIFHARCVRVQVGTDSILGQPVTYVTLVPQSAVKGTLRGQLTIKLLGNQSPSARPGEETEGLPRFAEGEEVILFLYPDSAHGLTSPVGFGQGKFRVLKDKSGQAQAINGFGNERLLDGLSVQAQEKLGERMKPYRGRGPQAISPEALLDMVRSLGR